MAISTIGQLPLCTDEALYIHNAVFANVGDGDDPVIADDPADADKDCLKLNVGGANSGDLSRIRYSLSAAVGELWIEVRLRWDQAASAVTALRMLHFLDASDVAITRLTQVGGGSDTRWGIAATPSSFSSLDMSENTWARLRLRYKKGTGANAIYQAWVHSAGSWVLVVDVSTGASTADVKTIELCCEPASTLATTAVTKISYFQNLAWDAVATSTANYTGWKDDNLEFGAACSVSSATTIDIRFQFQVQWTAHNYQLEATAYADLTSPFVQIQRSPAGAGTWTDVGSTGNLTANGLDGIVNITVIGNSPLTAYDFRAVLKHDTNVTVMTTEAISITTPSASSGAASSSLKLAWSSCEHQNQHPKLGYAAIVNEAPHAYFQIGDNAYCTIDNTIGAYTLTGSQTDNRMVYRASMFHEYNRKRCSRAMAQFLMWDDHETAVNNFVAADSLGAAITTPANLFLTNRRLNGFTNGRGFWADYAKTRVICLDMRTAKDLSGTDTILGAGQLAEVLAKLTNTGKPINILFCPGPSVQDHSSMGADAADGFNATAELLAERDLLHSTFNTTNPAGSILIICSGDRHFAYDATDWEADYGGRVKPEFCASPMAFTQRDVAGLTEAGNTTINFLDDDAEGAVISRYGLITINEQALTVTVQLKDGADGTTLHTSETMQASGGKLLLLL